MNKNGLKGDVYNIMILEFKNNKIQKECENPKKAQQAYGEEMKKKLLLRVNELRSSDTLEDVSYIPAARLHRLKGNRSHQYAVDLVHPFRLVFAPKCDAADLNKLNSIEIVKIEEVVDYHGN